jgi:hypothetical protein
MERSNWERISDIGKGFVIGATIILIVIALISKPIEPCVYQRSDLQGLKLGDVLNVNGQNWKIINLENGLTYRDETLFTLDIGLVQVK